MKLLIDVDALVKMAHWRMLPELPGSLDISWSNCATVSSLKFRASRAATEPDGKLFISTQAAQAAVLAIAEMSELAEPLPGHLELFQDISGIDAGEAILFAGIMGDDSTYVLTGDKRALRALSNIQFTGRITHADGWADIFSRANTASHATEERPRMVAGQGLPREETG